MAEARDNEDVVVTGSADLETQLSGTRMNTTPRTKTDARANADAAADPASNSNSETWLRLDIPVTGMTCAACATRIQKKLSKTEGVREAAVNFATERATVEYEAGATGVAELVEAVKAIGYGARLEELVLDVEGLEMAVSGEAVERELDSLPGVVDVAVNLASG